MADQQQQQLQQQPEQYQQQAYTQPPAAAPYQVPAAPAVAVAAIDPASVGVEFKPTGSLAALYDRRPLLYTIARGAQALFALIGLISLAATNFSYFTYGYGGGNGFYYFDAVTQILVAAAFLLIPRFAAGKVPKLHVIQGIADFVYLWFWLGAAGTVATLSNWCISWNNSFGAVSSYYGGDSYKLNCGGVGAAAAFGFFAAFTTAFALFLDILPILTGFPANQFLNSYDGTRYPPLYTPAPATLTTVVVQQPVQYQAPAQYPQQPVQYQAPAQYPQQPEQVQYQPPAQYVQQQEQVQYQQYPQQQTEYAPAPQVVA